MLHASIQIQYDESNNGVMSMFECLLINNAFNFHSIQLLIFVFSKMYLLKMTTISLKIFLNLVEKHIEKKIWFLIPILRSTNKVINIRKVPSNF